ncbi:hypothetical protein LX97_00520 [Nonlabens dokdonensis]|uniref:Uncharacterized protein n=1 Tax=Nonlabens dokdonensis TaxID=328515 RepID=A0ABX5Q0G6_9FLAO|nr:hypothetical protein [Nonlabens dokdonensis]PZX43519.1 hypothetical protein LX97_00520 [Nonlabens dokdonensis]
MRTIITLGVGFWLGRQLYINHDKRVARAKETRLKRRLVSFLKEKDLDTKNAQKQANQLLSN